MTWGAPNQQQIDWLIASGVTVDAMIHPATMQATRGNRAADGRFEADATGPCWLVFPEPEDEIFWQPRTGEIATDTGRAFALGEAVIDDHWTYSFTGNLRIFADPLDWLRAGRDGIVIVDWSRTWSRLQDCPQIAVDRRLANRLRRHLRPPYTPRVVEMEAIAA